MKDATISNTLHFCCIAPALTKDFCLLSPSPFSCASGRVRAVLSCCYVAFGVDDRYSLDHHLTSSWFCCCRRTVGESDHRMHTLGSSKLAMQPLLLALCMRHHCCCETYRGVSREQARGNSTLHASVVR